MSIAIIVPDRDISTFVTELRSFCNEQVFVNPSSMDLDKVETAILWNHPIGTISSFPNLKLICSFGAGVDHITSDPEYNPAIPLTRIVDEELTESMTRYVVAAVSMFQYGFHFSGDKELGQQYIRKPIHPPELTVGILGLGALGEASAKCISELKYKVLGISRRKKDLDGVHTFALSEMDTFLSQTNILICMLPLTNETMDMVDYQMLSSLRNPSYFINVGRGNQVKEEDLLKGIKDEFLLGACLDVVKNEPIKVDHPFIKESRIILTPHIASITNQRNAARIIGENINRFRNGEKLRFQVDPNTGY